jgi:transcriptional regulator with XRE-family HTH domain
MTLAERVTALREERGLNQKNLADASGITQATISRIESGQVEDLKAESLKSLASALRVTVDYLVGRTDTQTGSDVASTDPAAHRILETYGALSPAGQKMVQEFVAFVRQRERGSRGRRPILKYLARRSRRRVVSEGSTGQR